MTAYDIEPETTTPFGRYADIDPKSCTVRDGFLKDILPHLVGRLRRLLADAAREVRLDFATSARGRPIERAAVMSRVLSRPLRLHSPAPGHVLGARAGQFGLRPTGKSSFYHCERQRTLNVISALSLLSA
jgi:hypothetical protein